MVDQSHIFSIFIKLFFFKADGFNFALSFGQNKLKTQAHLFRLWKANFPA